MRPAPQRSSDAEFIDDDVYASDRDPRNETEPNGLVDRLYADQIPGRPMRARGPMQSVPTTNNRFL